MMDSTMTGKAPGPNHKQRAEGMVNRFLVWRLAVKNLGYRKGDYVNPREISVQLRFDEQTTARHLRSLGFSTRGATGRASRSQETGGVIDTLSMIGLNTQFGREMEAGDE